MPTQPSPDSGAFDDDEHARGTAFTDPTASAQGLGWQLQRWLLVLAVLCCTAALLASLWMPQQLGPLAFGAMLGGYGVLALAGLAGLRMPPRRAPLLRLLLLGGASALVALGGWAGGWALAEPGLPLLVLAVGLVSMGSRRGLATLATLPALAALAWLGWCQAQVAPGGAPLPPWPVHLLMLAAAVVAAAAAGQAVARTQEAQEALAARHGDRLDAMLAMAVDTHWETDASLRFTVFRRRDRQGRLTDMPECLGRRPWDLPLLAMDDETADLLRADTDARETLHQLAVSWRCSDGQRRHYLVSGEPRADAQGQHGGYWGVAVDVSAERAALASAADSQVRHSALFQGLPVALVLHRHGDILDANPAAARLLGYRSPSAMRGHNLLAEHMDEDQRELALDRLEDLDAEPDLDSLPAVPRRLRQRSGEPVYTLAQALRSDEAGRPASLAVYLDESARHAAESLLQQHEALLARLLATSHDAVLLADLDHDRVLLANDALARLTGQERGQLAGQALSRLPLWPDAHSLDDALQQLRSDGLVPGQVMAACAADGRTLTLRLSATRLQQGELSCALLVLQDLTELTQLRRPPAAAAAPTAATPGPQDDGVALHATGSVASTTASASANTAASAGAAGGADAAAAQARAALLAQTSQLLRPPVNQLLAHWRQLYQPRQSAAQQARNLGQAGESVQALARVVNDLVDLARLQTGPLALQAAPFSLPSLLADLVQVFAPAAQARGLGLALQAAPSLPAWQLGDAGRLRQLLVALLHQQLSHAVAAPGTTTVRLVVAEQADGLTRFSLWAPGPAGPADSLTRPFGTDAGADAAQTAHQLALALAQQLAQALGGRLGTDSDNAAHTASTPEAELPAWVLVLPLPATQAPAPAPAPSLPATAPPAPTPVQTPGPEAVPSPDPTPDPTPDPSPAAALPSAPGPSAHPAGGQPSAEPPLAPSAALAPPAPVVAAAAVAPAVQATTTAAMAPTNQLLQGVRVLLVEDNQINRVVVQAVLEDWGLQVAPASHVAQALALGAQAAADQRPFELALVSLQLQDLGAAELTQGLHRQVPAERLPVLGLADQASPTVPRPPGMVAVLGRPLTAAPLRAALLQALAQGRGQAGLISPA